MFRRQEALRGLRFIRYGTDEYMRGNDHGNTVEGFYSVLKRGMMGVCQHYSEKHLHRYVAELNFRYNNRTKLGVDDAQRSVMALIAR